MSDQSSIWRPPCSFTTAEDCGTCAACLDNVAESWAGPPTKIKLCLKSPVVPVEQVVPSPSSGRRGRFDCATSSATCQVSMQFVAGVVAEHLWNPAPRKVARVMATPIGQPVEAAGAPAGELVEPPAVLSAPFNGQPMLPPTADVAAHAVPDPPPEMQPVALATAETAPETVTPPLQTSPKLAPEPGTPPLPMLPAMAPEPPTPPLPPPPDMPPPQETADMPPQQEMPPPPPPESMHLSYMSQPPLMPPPGAMMMPMAMPLVPNELVGREGLVADLCKIIERQASQITELKREAIRDHKQRRALLLPVSRPSSCGSTSCAGSSSSHASAGPTCPDRYDAPPFLLVPHALWPY